MNDLIGSIHALKRRANTEHATTLLHKIAAQVRPIMHARGWRVGTLREFYPRTPNLLGLNVNKGLEIRLRLRSPHADSEFLPFEDLVGTMLHELVHNERSPHDKVFYALLDEITAETEKLMAKGYSGDGFYSEGQRVGVGVSHNVPRYKARELAARAVERRHRFSQAPRTLGSIGDQHLHTPAQMAAMALDRRLRDEKWCGAALAQSDDDLPQSTDSSDLIIIVSDSDSESDSPIIIN
ncbi:hypothetical protein GGH96_001343 [Coemansia sp. RSA 1972]|nr:hypothetical protein GGH96_001343 [Coemansia sp. RSA 1972]